MDRRLVGVILAAVMLVAMGAALFAYNRDRAEPRFSVIEADGGVEISSSRGAVAAVAGTRLAPEDRVRTDADGRAVLGLGQETRIRIASSSSLQILAVDDEGVRLELEEGSLQATVRPDSGAVRVGNRGREVQSTDGSFALAVDGDLVAAEAIEGDLMLQGLDAMKLEAGSRATIQEQRASVGPIPEELLLSVDWPDAVPTRESRSVFEGHTSPGARVTVIGKRGTVIVRANSAGTFTASVDLAEGENAVRVLARDMLGEEVEVSGRLQILRTRPALTIDPPDYVQPAPGEAGR